MSRKEAAAEIEAGGRRKEIADEAIRQAVCGSRKTEATAWNCGNKKDMVVSTEKLRLFLCQKKGLLASKDTDRPFTFLWKNSLERCKMGLEICLKLFVLWKRTQMEKFWRLRRR